MAIGIFLRHFFAQNALKNVLCISSLVKNHQESLSNWNCILSVKRCKKVKNPVLNYNYNCLKYNNIQSVSNALAITVSCKTDIYSIIVKIFSTLKNIMNYSNI